MLRTFNLAVQFYQLAQKAPVAPHLRIQLLRAASSIALNLQEGYGRSGNADRLRFFHIAFGSVRECQAVVALEPTRFTEQQKRTLDHLAASTYKLIRNSPLGKP